jgi:hypothetical protein
MHLNHPDSATRGNEESCEVGLTDGALWGFENFVDDEFEKYKYKHVEILTSS